MKQLSNQALAWLSLIFKERFGHSFTLKSVEDGISMTLVNQSKGEIIFPHTFPEFFQSRSDIPFTTWDAEAEGWDSVLKEPLPAPGIASLSTRLIEQDYVKSKKVYIKYDILGLTYWMLNRIEEIGRTDLDNHERFPAINSHAYKYSYLDRPIVDEWLDILKQVINKVWPDISLRENKYQLLISHDVDFPSLYKGLKLKQFLKLIIVEFFKNKRIKQSFSIPYIYIYGFLKPNILHKKDPFNTFDYLMSISEKYNLKSSFYFIGDITDPSKDCRYRLSDGYILNLLSEINERGHEIGLHPSYNSYKKNDQIKREFNNLKKIFQKNETNNIKYGGRMHYLRWKHPNTLQKWNDAGLDYDSTLGYADLPGFRCGTCYEYTSYDPMYNQILKIKIRPLIVMDCTVISTNYLNLGYTDEASERILALKNKCSKVGGNFTFLWHNSFFKTKSSFNFYEKIISESLS